MAPAAKRQTVAHLVVARGMSEQRVCRVMGCLRMTMRYETIRRDDPVLRERLKEPARVLRCHVPVQRRGTPMTVTHDNGTEFTSNAILTFADDCKIDWHYIAPC